MKIDYKRKIGIQELGRATDKPYLSLIGNVVGKNVKDVGHYIKKSIESFCFIINGDRACLFPGKRTGVNQFTTEFITAFSLEKDDVLRIHFDSEYKKSPFLINIEVPKERYRSEERRVGKEC